ncbi:MAG: IS630 family transposase, partial [Rubrobacter sp.]|nr:IS630 family transposase [Rubrobacter sp.]
MQRRKNAVMLPAEERERLGGLISRGSASTHELTHARILLKADEGGAAPEARWP